MVETASVRRGASPKKHHHHIRHTDSAMRVLVFIAAAVLVAAASAEDAFDSTGIRLAMKIYDDCSKTDDGFSPCLKKKAITFVDRLSRMEKLPLVDGVVVKKSEDAPATEAPITEEQLETTLPRAADAKEDALNNMLLDKVTKFVGSRTVEVNLPTSLGIEEGRKKQGGGGGGMKGMMGGMMMGMAAKMAALIPIAIAGLFLLAGKALITAKIALLLSGIIAIKKLFASKQGGGGGGGHGHSSGGWQSGGGGGGGGGWQSSGGGGGWDKRSIDETNKLAYKAYSPK